MLLVVGNVMCISALAFAERVLCQPLTPYLHIIDLHQHDPLQLESAARALLAMRVVIQQIASFVAPLSKLYIQSAAQHYFKQLAEQVWAGSQTVFGMAPRELVAQQWPWRLQNPALDVQPLMAGKHLYVVRCQQLQPRVFKYMRGYSQEVHQALAACHPPLAPQLHSCIQLPGGWSEVQMELLATEQGWAMLHSRVDRDALRPAVVAELTRAHGILVAGQQLVLGDARDNNVMVRTEAGSLEVRFIDLDWAGIQGVARYPATMNPMVAWPEGAESGALILQQHDRQLLSSTQQELAFPVGWESDAA